MAARSRSGGRWIEALVGLLCVLLGTFLIFNPFYSLAVLLLALGSDWRSQASESCST